MRSSWFLTCDCPTQSTPTCTKTVAEKRNTKPLLARGAGKSVHKGLSTFATLSASLWYENCKPRRDSSTARHDGGAAKASGAQRRRFAPGRQERRVASLGMTSNTQRELFGRLREKWKVKMGPRRRLFSFRGILWAG